MDADHRVLATSSVVPQRFRIDVASWTDTGPRQEHNEEGDVASLSLGLYLVTEGMGGHRTGDRATEIIVDAMPRFFAASHARPAEPWPFVPYPDRPHEENRLAGAVRAAGRAIRAAVQRRPEMRGSGSTVAAVSIIGDRIQLAHVGHCRIYRLRAGVLEQLTRDHTLYTDALEHHPDISPEELAAIPRNVITRAVGMDDDVLVDTRTETSRTGDLYLLATDGAYRSLEAHEIASILLGHPTLDIAVRSLVDAALARDGDDNATALLLLIGPRLATAS
ncbi:Protein serine/threonine phosphatase PrpC, regulation of stationary phase [Minicystis rosea]|nr:Protein serine/threonine phosphatase PrpC, regulation of stationary phase [Minicystis rosea]